MPTTPGGGSRFLIRQRKLVSQLLARRPALNPVYCTPIGPHLPMTCSVVPPLPAVSMPCSTISTLRVPPAVDFGPQPLLQGGDVVGVVGQLRLELRFFGAPGLPVRIDVGEVPPLLAKASFSRIGMMPCAMSTRCPDEPSQREPRDRQVGDDDRQWAVHGQEGRAAGPPGIDAVVEPEAIGPNSARPRPAPGRVVPPLRPRTSRRPRTGRSPVPFVPTSQPVVGDVDAADLRRPRGHRTGRA